jgi:MFS transporter, PCFT/HCP family, solute carrier family 46 (folate transporter), member 1
MLGTVLTLVWALGVLRFWLEVPVRLIWIAPVFQAIGGGNTVTVAVIYSIVADVESEAYRYACR